MILGRNQPGYAGNMCPCCQSVRTDEIINRLHKFSNPATVCDDIIKQFQPPFQNLAFFTIWSRGSLLAFSTQVRGFKPGRSRRIFKGEKILSTPSFGGEVKPSVPCRRFAERKRSLNGVEVDISTKLPDNILAHSSHFHRWDLSRRCGRGGTW